MPGASRSPDSAGPLWNTQNRLEIYWPGASSKLPEKYRKIQTPRGFVLFKYFSGNVEEAPAIKFPVNSVYSIQGLLNLASGSLPAS